MPESIPARDPLSDRILAAIVSKFNANRGRLAGCKFGRITWRVKPNDDIEIDVEPKL